MLRHCCDPGPGEPKFAQKIPSFIVRRTVHRRQRPSQLGHKGNLLPVPRPVTKKREEETNCKSLMHLSRPRWDCSRTNIKAHIRNFPQTALPFRFQQLWDQDHSGQAVMTFQPAISNFLQGMDSSSRREVPNPRVSVDFGRIDPTFLGLVEPFRRVCNLQGRLPGSVFNPVSESRGPL